MSLFLVVLRWLGWEVTILRVTQLVGQVELSLSVPRAEIKSGLA